MNKSILKLSLGVLFSALVFLTASGAHAWDSACKNPNVYSVRYSINPPQGAPDQEFQIQMEFKWNNDALQTCVNTPIVFEVFYQNKDKKDYTDIEKLDLGKIERNKWVSKVVTMRAVSLPGLETQPKSGDEIQIGFFVTQKNMVLTNTPLFQAIYKSYFVKVAKPACAFVTSGGKYSCVPNPNSVSDCNALPVCNGGVCTKIDSSKCGSTAVAYACISEGDKKYACSPANRSDCSDVSGCKQCLQIDPSKCGQVSEGGGGTQSVTQKYVFNLENPIKADNFQDLVNIIGQWIFNLAIPIAVIIIIYAGFTMLTSGGNPGRFQGGAKTLWYAVIGLAIILIGKGFVTLVKSIIGLKNQ